VLVRTEAEKIPGCVMVIRIAPMAIILRSALVKEQTKELIGKTTHAPSRIMKSASCLIILLPHPLAISGILFNVSAVGDYNQIVG
jgi:ADP-ribosylglycohydrolase